MTIEYKGHLNVGGGTILITDDKGFPSGLAEELAKLLTEGKSYCEMTIDINVHEGEGCLRVCPN